MHHTEFVLPGLDLHLVAVVRWELFVFGDVRDVQHSPIPDTVVVVHRGDACPTAWRATLLAVGIGTRQPAPAVGVTEQQA